MESVVLNVSFRVGPQQKERKFNVIPLISASVVFETKLNDEWRNVNPIILRKFDPSAFSLFMKLLRSRDTWSLRVFEDLCLSLDIFFGLLAICRYFDVPEAITHLEVVGQDYTRSFHHFCSGPQFFKTTQVILKTILSCSRIPMSERDIYYAVRRWSAHQMQDSHITIRDTLGDIIYEIRFPTMNSADFEYICSIDEILTAQEKDEIRKYISLPPHEKLSYDTAQLGFGTDPRNGGTVVDLWPEWYPQSQFYCKASPAEFEIRLSSNRTIEIYCLAFQGPPAIGSYYDVIINITRKMYPQMNVSCPYYSFRVFGEPNEVFYCIFPTPVTLERRLDLEDLYSFHIKLKGYNTTAAILNKDEDFYFQLENTTLNFRLETSPLAELQFKEI